MLNNRTRLPLPEPVAWTSSRNGGMTWITTRGDPTDLMPDEGGIVHSLHTDNQLYRYSDAECAPLMEEIEALRQDGSKLTADNAALQTTLADSRAYVERLKSRADEHRNGRLAALEELAALRAEVECMSGEMMRAGAQVNALQANERRLIDKMWKTQQQRDRLSAALQVIADDVCDNSYTRTARAALKEGGKLPPPIDIARAAPEGEHHYLGVFVSKEDAHKAYIDAAKQLHQLNPVATVEAK